MGGSDVETHSHRAVASHLPIVLLLAFGAIVGLLLGNDYGPSLDEIREVQLGEDALKAYVGSQDYFSQNFLRDHGPVYFMLFSATSRLVHGIAPSWSLADGRHLSNYVTFMIGVMFFYRLCLLLMSPRSAWIATALLATQPLLFGYGFVGQKDIPFLTFFLATIVTGVKAADQWTAHAASAASDIAEPVSLTAPAHPGRNTLEWNGLSLSRRTLLLSASGLALLLVVDLFFMGMAHRLGQSAILAAYDGRAPSLVQRAFSVVATDAYKTSVEAYLAKYDTLFVLVRMYLTVGLAGGFLVGTSQAFPTALAGLGFSRRALSQPAFLGSAVFLGITICIRQVGALAGVIVGLSMLYRGRSRALLPVVAYSVIAALVTYATWPYLWPDPLRRFTGSVSYAANFQLLHTFFKGTLIRSDQLPLDYFPRLAGLQLTEPAVLLILLGSGATVWRLAKRKTWSSPIAVLGLWVGVPVLALALRAIPAYGIRHLLFVFPPLFVLAGVGLETLAERVRRNSVRLLIFGAAILPGILGIVQLHPYEYIYFNSLAGGVSGADGVYALDRLCLSYREATEAVNQIADSGASVAVNTDARTIVPDYLRTDLTLLPRTEHVEGADFVISCVSPTRAGWQTGGFERVYEVRRGTAVLAEVWQRVGQADG
jgi:4-amino-4-deoxy-L-arabinose transferase-like glycosyltransferase